MDDLIDLNMDSPSPTSPTQPIDLIDMDFDGMNTASPAGAAAGSDTVVNSMDAASPPGPDAVPGSIPQASSATIINNEDTAARAWNDCLKASLDKVKYPVVSVAEGPFAKGPLDEFETMWQAKQKGQHDFKNPFLRPTGPTKDQIILLQSLNQQGHSLDYIAHYLVVTFPGLMQGWKDGTEYDRRIQIHGLVNIWSSMWAPKIAQDGRVLEAEGDGGDGGKEGEEKRVEETRGEVKGIFKSKEQAKPYVKLNVPDWLKK
ncbi:MAG: hypothetical protein Q9195_008616 [Heterodermia aff. obscurata]